MASSVGAAGWERRGLRGISRHVWIRVTIAESVGQPAALPIEWNAGRGNGPPNQISPTRIFPPKSGAEQLIAALVIDLGDQLCLCERADQRRQTRLGIVDPAIAGAIGPYRIENSLRLRQLVGVC